MRILVTGGAGYIGSFMTRRLLDKGYDVVVLDSLERGKENHVDSRSLFVQIKLQDKEQLEKIFDSNPIDTIIHFAAFISMGESMEKPFLYFDNNTFGALNLIEVAREKGVKKIIFSSTAGIYGNPLQVPIPEDHVKNPTNPYGESKLFVEKILEWYSKTAGIRCIALRYFNASGADPDGKYGEDHIPETHIIPNAINAVLDDAEFVLYGSDYETADGTCVRDYIHVMDLVEAHILSLEKLEHDEGFYAYNVGTGHGYSNREVISMVEKVAGRQLKIKIEMRRSGDAAVLVADPTKIRNELGFNPQFSDLETIVTSAYAWHQKNIK